MLNFNINFSYDKPRVIQKKKYNYNKINIVRMKEMLDIDWTEALQDKNPEDAYNLFLSKYNEAVEECVPTSFTSVSNKYTKPVWMKGETLKLIKKKHHMHIKVLNTNLQEDKDQYKMLRNQVTHQLRDDRTYEHRMQKR